MNTVTLHSLEPSGNKMKPCQLLTGILEQPVFHNEFVVLHSLCVHLIVFVLVCQIEQHLKVTESLHRVR